MFLRGKYEGKTNKTCSEEAKKVMKKTHQEKSEYHSWVYGTITNLIKLAKFVTVSLLRFVCSLRGWQMCYWVKWFTLFLVIYCQYPVSIQAPKLRKLSLLCSATDKQWICERCRTHFQYEGMWPAGIQTKMNTWPSQLNHNLSNCEVARKKKFWGLQRMKPLKPRKTSFSGYFAIAFAIQLRWSHTHFHIFSN